MAKDDCLLEFKDVAKHFTMHLQDSALLPVVEHVSFDVRTGECVVLGGPSGAGKSSLLKMAYGNYLAQSGMIRVRYKEGMVDIVTAGARLVLDIRKRHIGYVSQFLSGIPRVSALDLVAKVARDWGADDAGARHQAGEMLARLNIPGRLWGLPPATFSGGEQQRVNIARGFIGEHPLLLLDEPTASLDATNGRVVLDLIEEKKTRGTGMLGIFHDPATRAAVADRIIDVTQFSVAA